MRFVAEANNQVVCRTGEVGMMHKMRQLMVFYTCVALAVGIVL